MLRLHLHAGSLEGCTSANRLAFLDIGYEKLEPMANYRALLFINGLGELPVCQLENYPRWSGSLWDLVARCLVRALYGKEQIPALPQLEKGKAYATAIAVRLEIARRNGASGIELGRGQLEVIPRSRGLYRGWFEEDILGRRELNRFEHKVAFLSPADLVLRALTQTLFGAQTLGPVPELILPDEVVIDGQPYAEINTLPEPARTGFLRAAGIEDSQACDSLVVPAENYVQFLSF